MNTNTSMNIHKIIEENKHLINNAEYTIEKIKHL